jgi:hypothetical protein
MDINDRDSVLNLLVVCRKKIFSGINLPPEQLYDFLNANYTNDELAEFILFVYDGFINGKIIPE